MPAGKGKRVAVAVTTLVTAVLSIAGLVFWRDLAESWHLRRLEWVDAAAKRAAVDRLGAMRSVRAIPALMKAAYEPDAGLRQAILRASKSIGPEGARVAFVLATSDDFPLAQSAAETLTEMGPGSTTRPSSARGRRSRRRPSPRS